MIGLDFDSSDLKQVGWGVIFPADTDSDFRTALAPLLELRREQAGELYREFRAGRGYRSGEKARDWLGRMGLPFGEPFDPELGLPYYLLIVGSPAEIPFEFQFDLAAQFAVGRLDFCHLGDYSEYGRRQVSYETRWEPPHAKTALVFAPIHRGDPATRELAEYFIHPLIEEEGKESLPARQLRFQLQTRVGESATKAALQRALQDDPAALLFLSGHGLPLRKTESSPDPAMGALVCQDFEVGNRPVSREEYFSDADMQEVADLRGAMVFAAVSYFAGVLPRGEGPADENGEAYVAALPREMLRRGAQAVIGKVGDMWLLEGGKGVRPRRFREILVRLMRGSRAGEVAGLLAQRAALLAVQQSELKDSLKIQRQRELEDARGWILLGDPAARLRVEEMDSPIAGQVLDPSLPRLPEPEVPAELAQACAEGGCVAVCGWGLNAKLGGVNWPGFLADLVRFAVERGLIPPAQGAAHLKALREGLAGAVADSLSTQLADVDTAEFVRGAPHLSGAFEGTLQDLSDLNFCGVLSGTFYALGESLLRQKNVPRYQLEDAAALKEAHARRQPFVLDLYGAAEKPESLILSDLDFQKRVVGHLPFTQFLEGLLASRTLFFLGCSLDGIERYFQALSSRIQSGPRHYALVAAHEPHWKVKADSLLSRFNIEVVPYTDETHGVLDRFVAALGARTKALGRDLSLAPEIAPESQVTGIELQDIGPFRQFRLDLPAKWRILLGDNGVGKSTILKALAAAVAGDEIRTYAGRLLRVGCTSGKITLFTRRQPTGYTIEIAQGEAETSVRCTPARVMDAEPFLTLSFPPVRGIGWTPVSGPQAAGGGSRPLVEDLIPILRGDDPRADRLKQWIVNLDYRRKSEPRAERVLQAFLEALEQLAAGSHLESIEVGPKFQVLVHSQGVPLPIELLSQGTASLLSWISLLVQRLYEMNDFAEDSLSKYALVLVDELDAHMHPGWQQRLVFELKKLFPNVQFVASTHSPLLIGGLSPEEVTRLERVDGTVAEFPVDAEMLMGRAEDRLTNPLFGLRTSLDMDTQNLIRRYKGVLGRREPSAEEKAERAELEKTLKKRIPVGGEVEVRLHAEAVAEALDAFARPPSEAEWKEILRQAAELGKILGKELKNAPDPL